MKNSIRVFFLMFFALNVSIFAQSIQMIDGESSVDGLMTEEELIADGIVKNVTDKVVKFKVRFEVIEIAPEHSLSICYNQCFDVVNIDYEIPAIYTLGPGETNLDAGDIFSMHCYPFRKILDDPITYIGPAPGKTKIIVYFTNADDILDESEFEMTFNFKDPTSVDDELLPEGFGISKIFPNPANEMTKIEFSYNKEEDFPHLELYDINGNKLYDYEICKCEDFLYLNTKEFSNGTYYIQMVGNNRKSKNQMLLINR